MAKSKRQQFQESLNHIINLKAQYESYSQLGDVIQSSIEAMEYLEDESKLVQEIDKLKAQKAGLEETISNLEGKISNLASDYDAKIEEYEAGLNASMDRKKAEWDKAADEARIRITALNDEAAYAEKSIKLAKSKLQRVEMETQQQIANLQSDVLDWEDKAERARKAAQAILGG